MICFRLSRFASILAAGAAFSTTFSTTVSAWAQTKTLVEVASKPGGKWTSRPTRTLADLPAAIVAETDANLDDFGGLRTRKQAATGFFRAQKIGGRWWLIDPLGGLTLNKAVVSVTPMATEGGRAALAQNFGDEAGWARQTGALLRQNGFNGTGSWSKDAALQGQKPRLAYTPIWNLMSGYGKKRGGTFQQPGHTGYPGDAIFVFDPEFRVFCDDEAKKLAATKDDPWLLGHFSDNELPFRISALKNFLALPATDTGHEAAQKWLQARHGEGASDKDITPADESDFLGFVIARYLEITSQAIKKYDPNHLFLGPRFHGTALNKPEVFRAAGPYLDVVAVNYYGAWTPDAARMAMWERESGKPFLITEWYAKGEDSGMANTGGAGWLVKTQADRGRFYQNFALGLLESRNCVGWQWFKYIDNDPANLATDPSNRDSNKGIVTARYETYPPLLDAMRELNTRVYRVVDEFDRAKP